MKSDTPLELGAPRRSVVRLNRRVIYVVGAVLAVAFVAGLFAIRAQGTRLTAANAERRTAQPPRSQPWFEGVPDHAPGPRPALLDTVSPSASPGPTKAPSGDEDEAQRRR